MRWGVCFLPVVVVGIGSGRGKQASACNILLRWARSAFPFGGDTARARCKRAFGAVHPPRSLPPSVWVSQSRLLPMQAHAGYRFACQMVVYALRSARRRALHAGGLLRLSPSLLSLWPQHALSPSLPGSLRRRRRRRRRATATRVCVCSARSFVRPSVRPFVRSSLWLGSACDAFVSAVGVSLRTRRSPAPVNGSRDATPPSSHASSPLPSTTIILVSTPPLFWAVGCGCGWCGVVGGARGLDDGGTRSRTLCTLVLNHRSRSPRPDVAR